LQLRQLQAVVKFLDERWPNWIDHELKCSRTRGQDLWLICVEITIKQFLTCSALSTARSPGEESWVGARNSACHVFGRALS